MRRKIRRRPRPSDCAASVWPCGTERMPPRTISAANAATSRVSPTNAATRPLNRCAVGTARNVGPNGTPSDSVGYSDASSYQNSNCTSGGVLRNAST